MKPFLKWVGGKTQCLDEVLALFPQDMHHYHEPFVGGGSVLLGLLARVRAGHVNVRGRVHASDANENLIWLYRNIQARPAEVVAELAKLTDDFRAAPDVARTGSRLKGAIPSDRTAALAARDAYYYWVRARFNAMDCDARTSPAASAMMLFLNKTCFRGLYREGPRGFNVAYGHYKNPAIFDPEHIMAVSEIIRDVVFTHGSYRSCLDSVQSNDFVYLDPPYAPEVSTSFVTYTAHGFTLDDHDDVFATCHRFTANGVRFVLSNADVPLVRDAFTCSEYTIHTISCRRAIHSKKPDTRTNEVLITT